jgi:ketosteroid isomerase-like protein
MATDVVIMPPDRPPIYRQRRGPSPVPGLRHFEETCSLVYEEVEAAGDCGFARAVVRATRKSKANNRVEDLSMTNLWILKKHPDGEWRFCELCSITYPMHPQQGRFPQRNNNPGAAVWPIRSEIRMQQTRC